MTKAHDRCCADKSNFAMKSTFLMCMYMHRPTLVYIYIYIYYNFSFDIESYEARNLRSL